MADRRRGLLIACTFLDTVETAAVVVDFQQLLKDDQSLSLSVASILALTKTIKRSRGTFVNTTRPIPS